MIEEKRSIVRSGNALVVRIESKKGVRYKYLGAAQPLGTAEAGAHLPAVVQRVDGGR